MKLFIGVGIDRYVDNDNIRELPGATTDVGNLGYVFKHDFHYDEVKLLCNEESNRLLNVFTQAVLRLGRGDTIVLYFVGHGLTGHGLTPSGKSEQLLLPMDVHLGTLSGAVNLEALLSRSTKPGLNRVVIIDACRAPLRRPASVDMSPSTRSWYESTSEAIHRDLISLYSKVDGSNEASPLAILNSCRDGQTAKLISAGKDPGGLYSRAIHDTFKDTFLLGKPIVLDDDFNGELQRRMDGLASQFRIDLEGQTPVRQGANLRLFGMEDRNAAQIVELLDQFEEQLANGHLDRPGGANCQRTLYELREKGVASDRLNELSARLDAAVAESQRRADREHDERLIEAARRWPGEQLYANYLTQCRLHEHDQEARDYLDNSTRKRDDEAAWQMTSRLGTIADYEDYLAKFPEGLHVGDAKRRLDDLNDRAEATRREEAERKARIERDAKRRLEAQGGDLATWRKVAKDAETDALRTEALNEVSRLEAEENRAESRRKADELAREENARRIAAEREAEEKRLSEERADAKRRKETEQEARIERDAIRRLNAKSGDLTTWREATTNAETEEFRTYAQKEVARLETEAEKKCRDDEAAREANARRIAAEREAAERKAEEERLAEEARIREAAKMRMRRECDDMRWKAARHAGDRVAWRKARDEAETDEFRAEAVKQIAILEGQENARRERDDERRMIALKSGDWAAWQKAYDNAETDEFRTEATAKLNALWATASRIEELEELEGKKRRNKAKQWESVGRGAGRAIKRLLELGVLGVAGFFVLLVAGAYLFGKKDVPVAPDESSKPTVSHGSAEPPLAAPPRSVPTVDAKPEWLARRDVLSRSLWWNSKAATPSEADKQWLQATIAHAKDDRWPEAQLALGKLYCVRIAAPTIPYDPRQCGQWMSEALKNSAFSSSAEKNTMAEQVGRDWFDLLVQGYDYRTGQHTGRTADEDFARALMPGLAAQKENYPGLALRLAITQICYAQPVDRAAARRTLQAVVSGFGKSSTAGEARTLLAQIDADDFSRCNR